MNRSINEEEMEVLNSMIEVFKKSEAIYHPSLFLEHLNKLIIVQLQESEYQNFKRAINRNLLGILNKQRGCILLKWLRMPNLKILTANFNREDTELFMPKNHNKIIYVFLIRIKVNFYQSANLIHFINIRSLQEMTLGKIKHYLHLIKKEMNSCYPE
jgi:hypothetical protein